MRRLLLVVSLSLPLLAVAGASAGQAGASTGERLLDCLRRPVETPARVVVTCADANSELVSLTWASWDTGSATASGTYVFNTCTPTCVAGRFVRYPALVQLSGALATDVGVVYTTLRWQYRSAGREHHETFSLLATPERLVGCLGRTSVAPSSFVVACADANSRFSGMRWTSWSLGAATATATYVYNTCTPTCVAGRFESVPATVELSGARLFAGGLAYRSLHWQYRTAGRLHRETFPLGP